jgi:hypothetical protein
MTSAAAGLQTPPAAAWHPAAPPHPRAARAGAR